MNLITTQTVDQVELQSAGAMLPQPVDMRRIATVILGGGQGTRLAPLTNARCKPAVPIAGKYCLIDIPISNALNSGCQQIFILTQFLSSSLHKHVMRTYRPGTFSRGFIELLPAELGPVNRSWFQGTADAVRQNMPNLMETSADYFLILSGDQLYNMNFQAMLQCALETHADLVVGALPVIESDAKRMGLLKLNEDRFITEFCEKPQDRNVLSRMKMPEFTIKQLGDDFDTRRQYLGSMGIYLFKRQALFDLLQHDPREDFGKHLIPTKVAQGSVAAFLHQGYWEDIGTIASFFDANIALTADKPLFNCHDENNPIFSEPLHLPPPKIINTQISNAMICDGALIEADAITSSIIGPRSVLKPGVVISNSYLMGNDFYKPAKQVAHLPSTLQIGENTIIDRAIIDKHVCIGRGVRLINRDKLKQYSSEHIHIRDGIIIVTSGASIPDNFVL